MHLFSYTGNSSLLPHATCLKQCLFILLLVSLFSLFSFSLFLKHKDLLHKRLNADADGFTKYILSNKQTILGALPVKYGA